MAPLRVNRSDKGLAFPVIEFNMLSGIVEHQARRLVMGWNPARRLE